MKRRVKPIFALDSVVVLLFAVMCPMLRAQSTVIESGTSTLAPTILPLGGFQGNPEEYLIISWSVTQNTISDIYTYSYTVNDPVGDVVLNDNGSLASNPQSVNNIEVSFNASAAGAVVGTPPIPNGGGFVEVTSVGVTWAFPVVNPGGASALLTFQSDLGPGMGNASATPAPWASTEPNGQQVPVPLLHTAPEPATMTLFALALLLVPFHSTLREKLAAKPVRVISRAGESR